MKAELFEYDLVLLNKKQSVMSKGFEKRGLKKVDEILESIKKEKFIPNPTPLCYWCEYCRTNPDKDEKHGNLCEYFSLWTRKNKTYDVFKKWGGKK